MIGGAEVSSFFATSDISISAAFKDTIAIKKSKSISVIRKIQWSQLKGRARKPRILPQTFAKVRNFNQSTHLVHAMIFFGKVRSGRV